MALIAIEFDEAQAHVASARVAGKRLQVQDLFTVELDGDDSSAAEQLKTALASHGLARSDAVVVVNRADVEMRELSVPPAPDNELPDMVRFIARNEFASFNDSWVLDYVLLGDDASQSRTVLAAAISPELNQQISSMAESAGLKIRNMVLRPYAAIDLIRETLDDGKCRVVLAPNGDQTDVMIVDGTKMIAARTVRIPADADPEQRVKMLVPEMRRTIAATRKILGDQAIVGVTMFGDSQDHQLLNETIKKDLDLDMGFVLPLSRVMSKSGLSRPEDENRFAALLGALVQQNSNQSHAIDFLHPRKPIKSKNDNSKLYLYGGLAAAVVLFVVMFGWWMLHSQNSNIASLELELRELKQNNDGKNGGVAVDQIVGEIAKIDQWKLKDMNWLNGLYEFSDRALTADEIIVDSFIAETNRRSGDLPKVSVATRADSFDSQRLLFESLDEDTFEVVLKGNQILGNNDEYPRGGTLEIKLENDSFQRIREFDDRAREFLQSKLAPQPEAAENSEAPSPDDESQ